MQTLNDMVASAVKQYSTRTALLEPVDSGEISTLTYTALAERVHTFAGYLQGQNFAKGQRLLLWSASSINWIVAFLGVLQVGGVVVPLDVNSKEDF
ncbi:MAG TPA: AMP-binding protein, partial [Ktedonobacteraceae bacterium]|nr:AMP-binding protein [Ktedonobacteraceae bacterium]